MNGEKIEIAIHRDISVDSLCRYVEIFLSISFPIRRDISVDSFCNMSRYFCRFLLQVRRDISVDSSCPSLFDNFVSFTTVC